jgi:urease accessory protein
MNRVALARLMQLCSQALPIGGYSYSHGLESAIERRVVREESSLKRWIADNLEFCMGSFEIPCLLSMAAAWRAHDGALAASLNEDYLATRESAELRSATVQMGHSLRALLYVLPDFPPEMIGQLRAIENPSLPCAWSAAASAWQIAPADAVTGYLWSWAENQVLVAMKTVPLGQSAGQRVLLELGPRIAQLAEAATTSPAPAWSNFAPALAILSSQHETQYSRLFRS